MTALLDINLFIALAWPRHEHHEAALAWFASRDSGHWATCPLTELGFIRILSTPAFSPDALTVENARALLAANVGHPRHEFWPDALSTKTALDQFGKSVRGNRQLTDAYLVALAIDRKGKVATFDGELRDLAGDQSEVIELVPAGKPRRRKSDVALDGES